MLMYYTCQCGLSFWLISVCTAPTPTTTSHSASQVSCGASVAVDLWQIAFVLVAEVLALALALPLPLAQWEMKLQKPTSWWPHHSHSCWLSQNKDSMLSINHGLSIAIGHWQWSDTRPKTVWWKDKWPQSRLDSLDL